MSARPPMHILVDLQALQTVNSRHRGIGRYTLSLFRAMVSSGRDIRFSTLFNGSFGAEYVEAVDWIADLVPAKAIHLVDLPQPTAGIDAANAWRARAGASLLKLKVDSIAPDFVHVASLFEALTDNSLTTIAPGRQRWAATIYDLIPWFHREIYLENADVRRWYFGKLECARQAELLFAISASARREAIDILGQPDEAVIDIQGDVDPLFDPSPVPEARRLELLNRLAIRRPFVLYTAGIDFRKNVEGLIQAYARLASHLRQAHQLVIVCKISREERLRLCGLVSAEGLGRGEVIFTGFIEDPELADLYRLCRLFIFPSLHEGFGMPLLEAMRCGAPVIGSNCSSMPEILAIEAAQFDPRSATSIVAKLTACLQDDGMIEMLRRNANVQQARYSWSESARRVLDGFEAAYDRRQHSSSRAMTSRRLSLAYVSPLPPERSGIADYSSELVPALSEYYDVTLVTDLKRVEHAWLDGIYPICSLDRFEAGMATFDRVLYQMGNSAEFHTETLSLLRQRAGVVVLHDFFISNLFHHLDATGLQPGVLREELFDSHGYAPLLQLRECRQPKHQSAEEAVVWDWPCSRRIFDNSYGTIVHSAFALESAKRYYGISGDDVVAKIPHLRGIPAPVNRKSARMAVGLASDAVVVCSFGLMAPTKLNAELVRAWCSSDLIDRPNHHLLFLGPLPGHDAEQALRSVIASHDATDRIRLVGFVDDDLFQKYLAAADCAVQLRTQSRGETSGVVLHCLAHGLPVIVNRHGTLRELPEAAARMVPDRFTDAELTTAIIDLLDNASERIRRIESGIAYIRDHCSSRIVGAAYRDAMERFYAANPNIRLDRCIGTIAEVVNPQPDSLDVAMAAMLAAQIVPMRRARQCLVDFTALAHPGQTSIDAHPHSSARAVQMLEALLATPCDDIRFETVYWDGHVYRYARQFTLRMLKLAPLEVEDDVVEIVAGDHLICGTDGRSPPIGATTWIRHQQLFGLVVVAVLPNDAPSVDSLVPDIFVRSQPSDAIPGATFARPHSANSAPPTDAGDEYTDVRLPEALSVVIGRLAAADEGASIEHGRKLHACFETSIS